MPSFNLSITFWPQQKRLNFSLKKSDLYWVWIQSNPCSYLLAEFGLTCLKPPWDGSIPSTALIQSPAAAECCDIWCQHTASETFWHKLGAFNRVFHCFFTFHQVCELLDQHWKASEQTLLSVWQNILLKSETIFLFYFSQFSVYCEDDFQRSRKTYNV